MILRGCRFFLQRASHFLQFCLVVLYVKAAQCTPPRYFYPFFQRLARFIGPKTPFHRRVEKNLDLAFPGKTPAEKTEIGKAAWENLVMIGADYSRVPLLAGRKDFFTIEGEEILLRYGLSEKPSLFFSGHIASWEIFRQVAARYGVKTGMTYRGFNNPFFEKISLKLMGIVGAPIFNKGRGSKAMIAHLLRGGKVMLLTDQRFNEGKAIPFFQKPAKTVDFPAEIAIKYDLPLIPVCVRRAGFDRYHIIVKPPLDTAEREGEARPERVIRILTAMNASLEEFIREKPGDWFWHHLRWK